MNIKTNKILNDLDDVAMGRAYHGNSLNAALATFILSDSERAMITRFRNGVAHNMDHVALQDFVRETRMDHVALQDFVRETRRNERD